jgi:hypothetical protein
MPPEILYNLRNIDGAIFVFPEESSLAPSFLSISDASWDLEKRLGLILEPGKEGVYLVSIPASQRKAFEEYMKNYENKEK